MQWAPDRESSAAAQNLWQDPGFKEQFSFLSCSFLGTVRRGPDPGGQFGFAVLIDGDGETAVNCLTMFYR